MHLTLLEVLENNIISLNGSEISDIEIEVYGNLVLNIFLWDLLHLYCR